LVQNQFIQLKPQLVNANATQERFSLNSQITTAPATEKHNDGSNSNDGGIKSRFRWNYNKLTTTNRTTFKIHKSAENMLSQLSNYLKTRCFKVNFMAANFTILEAAIEENCQGKRVMCSRFWNWTGETITESSARDVSPEGFTIKVVCVVENGGVEKVKDVGEMLNRDSGLWFGRNNCYA